MQGRVFLGDEGRAIARYVFGARDRCDETVFRFRTVRDDRYRYIRNFTPNRPFLQPNEYKEQSYPVWNLLKELDAQGKLTPVQKVLTAPTMPPEELYDLSPTRTRSHNLAASSEPAHRAALERLRGVLEGGSRKPTTRAASSSPPRSRPPGERRGRGRPPGRTSPWAGRTDSAGPAWAVIPANRPHGTRTPGRVPLAAEPSQRRLMPNAQAARRVVGGLTRPVLCHKTHLRHTTAVRSRYPRSGLQTPEILTDKG